MLWILPLKLREDGLANVTPLLDGGLRNAGHGPFILDHGRGIAHDQYTQHIRNVQEWAGDRSIRRGLGDRN